MKRIFTKNLVMYMGIALVISILAVFVLNTVTTSKNNRSQAEEKLSTVEEKLQSNDEEIARLTASVGENNLAKSRAFADILAADSSIFGNQEKLDEICRRLMVNELHIIDENGIIVSSTVPAYLGFDMGSGAQSAAFLEINRNPSVEIVQEPMMNVAEGKVTQYIGVARKDAPGFVQVGIVPEVMEQALMSTAVDKVLAEFDYGTNGYVFAVNKADNTIAASPNSSLIGTDAASVGMPVAAGDGSAKIDGVKGFYVTRDYNDLLIGTFLPSKEYYSARTNQTLLISINLIVVFIVLMLLINNLVDRKIITGVTRIEDELGKIAAGDFSVVVDERSTPEFSELSDGINIMVRNVQSHMSENESLVTKQKQDMEHTLSIIDSVKSACGDLDNISQKTLGSADDIYRGAENQKEAVRALESVMDDLKGKLYASADETTKITKVTESAKNRIHATESQMKELVTSIENISTISKKIETIIDEINGISGQTNLLALNASIEAARAGDAGRGFAVVATEVGELASRSSQAAHETTDLITHTINAIGEGMKLAENTVSTFSEVVKAINDIDSEADGVSELVRANVPILSEAVHKIEDIESVMDTNVSISQNSKTLSENMASVTEQLKNIVGNG